MCPFSLSYPSIFLAIFPACEISIDPLCAVLRTMLKRGYEVDPGMFSMDSESFQWQWGSL
jgi:hypothetical protein